MFFNFVLKEICMLHGLGDYQGIQSVEQCSTCREHIFPASPGNCADGSDIKYILLSLLDLEDMSLVGHYFTEREVQASL